MMRSQVMKVTFACPAAGPFLLILTAAEGLQVEAGASAIVASPDAPCFGCVQISVGKLPSWHPCFECAASVSDLVGNRPFRSGSIRRSKMLTRRDTQFESTSQEEALEYTHRWKLP